MGFRDLIENEVGPLSRFTDHILQNEATHTGNAERRAILEANQAARNSMEQVGHLENASIMLDIPPLDYHVIVAKYHLDEMDGLSRSKFWSWFLTQPESEPYRVRANDGKRIRRA